MLPIYTFFVLYIQNLGVKYPNMTREDPCVLSLSQPESCATSTESSIPGSAGSLARALKAKKACRFFFSMFSFYYCFVFRQREKLLDR